MYVERHKGNCHREEESFEYYEGNSESGYGLEDDAYPHKCTCGKHGDSRKKPCGHTHHEEFWCKCYKKHTPEHHKCGCRKPCCQKHKNPCRHKFSSLEEQYNRHFNCCKPHCKKVCPCCNRSY